MRKHALFIALAVLANLAAWIYAAEARGTGHYGHFSTVSTETRSKAVPREFEKLHPCPANGHTSGACPGYVRDHVIPLCAGGADSTGNMQWQSVADGKAKDRVERAECRH
jgi:hypothetical protein